MKKYKAIFFDLDHTLWDFEMNSVEAISELYDLYDLKNLGVNEKELFIKTYKTINTQMWDQYSKNQISKQDLRNGRFYKTLCEFKIADEKLSTLLSDDYLNICPLKQNLFPGTITLLEYLIEKYNLHIITNGFKEVQYLKIKNSGLDKFFDHIHISEEIGFKKPEPEIFHYAVSKSGTIHENCIMIGDNADTDIKGAINAGIDHILFNPENIKTSHEVKKSICHLNELHHIL